MTQSELEALQSRWNDLYKKTLPDLARSKDSVQSKWPVSLDHCFARIILDNAVGVTQPWTSVLKAPAYKNMTTIQLQDAIELGESIAVGESSLEDLNQRSLRLRGKAASPVVRGTKRKAGDSGETESKKKDSQTVKEESGISSYFLPSPQSPTEKIASPKQSKRPKAQSHDDATIKTTRQPSPARLDPKFEGKEPLQLIQSSDLTDFRKQVLSLLCQVPAGKYTTYAAMSRFITDTSHTTCARAIGNAMRNNPFAPVVPCHRVLAADGRIGGFGGHWGEDGKYATRKRDMLRDEGVRFDGQGKVVGGPFVAFNKM